MQKLSYQQSVSQSYSAMAKIDWQQVHFPLKSVKTFDTNAKRDDKGLNIKYSRRRRKRREAAIVFVVTLIISHFRLFLRKETTKRTS